MLYNIHIIAMATSNCMVKRQIIQLLTAISMYSVEGYYCCLQALYFYKVGLRRFSIID